MYTLEVHGRERLQSRVRNWPKQFRFAGAQALNDVGFIASRTDLPAEMSKVFDRATPYILKSTRVIKATPDKLSVELYPDTPGGKAIDPKNVLRAEVHGGGRKLKRSERALERVGILPKGFAMVPAAAAPRDAFGNVPGPFMVRLISYFQAFGEQGYRANMSARSIKRVARRGNPRVGPPRRFAHVAGVEYFVSYGRLRSPNPNSDATQNLSAGIWQRSGTHGSDVKPVFLFVRQPRYQVRLRMGEVIARTAQRELPGRYTQRLKGALSTAR